MADDTADRYVSQSTLHEILELLRENRTAMRDQIGGVSAQLATAATAITSRQDVANQRLSKAEEAIGGLQTDLDRVEEEVRTISLSGCQQSRKHLEAIDILVQAGVVPQVSGELPKPSRWVAPAKTAGIGAIAVAIFEAVKSAFQYLTGK